MTIVRVTFTTLPCCSTTSLTSGFGAWASAPPGPLSPCVGNWLWARSSIQVPASCGWAWAATAPPASRSTAVMPMRRVQRMIGMTAVLLLAGGAVAAQAQPQLAVRGKLALGAVEHPGAGELRLGLGGADAQAPKPEVKLVV